VRQGKLDSEHSEGSSGWFDRRERSPIKVLLFAP
jgi:hypothetical protein